jgi:methylenetetrahydrofolate reductase (NADPH)
MNEAMAGDHEAKGQLRRVLEAGGFAITAEIVPPTATDPELLLQKALPLRGLADAVNVPDGVSARAHMSALAAAGLLVRAGIEPILQMTCRDRNRIALQSDLLGAAALGITNLLILGGDQPAAGDQPEAKAVFDLDPRTLMRTAARIRDRGELPSGRKVAGPARFFIGAADMPIDPPAAWAPDGLLAKIAAGAQFAQTQFCMDAAIVRRYAARLREHGITERLHLLIGIAPPASARSARWIREHPYGAIIPDAIVARLEAAPDPRAEGRRICVELLQELAEIPGVAGAHVMAPLNEAALPEVLGQARLVLRRR